jgi:hypothetical protein
MRCHLFRKEIHPIDIINPDQTQPFITKDGSEIRKPSLVAARLPVGVAVSHFQRFGVSAVGAFFYPLPFPF